MAPRVLGIIFNYLAFIDNIADVFCAYHSFGIGHLAHSMGKK